MEAFLLCLSSEFRSGLLILLALQWCRIDARLTDILLIQRQFSVSNQVYGTATVAVFDGVLSVPDESTVVT